MRNIVGTQMAMIWSPRDYELMYEMLRCRGIGRDGYTYIFDGTSPRLQQAHDAYVTFIDSILCDNEHNLWSEDYYPLHDT